MQLDFKMFWLIVRYRWIEIQRQGNSWVLFFFCFFWSGLNWSCLLLQPVCCCQVISVRLPSVCFLPAQLYCFSPATILHGCTHSPAQPPDAVSDSLVLASSHTYSQGVVKVGFSLLTVIALGRAWLYMSGMNRAGSYRVMKICPQHLFLGTEEGDEGIGGSWRWGEEVTNRRAQCHPTALWRAREDLKLINMRCSGYIGIYRRARCKIWPRCLFCKWIRTVTSYFFHTPFIESH